MKTNTELLCNVLGWQGGTVHQVARETGLTVEEIIYTDRTLDTINGKSTSPGWFANRTCSLDHQRAVCFPARQRDLAFWMGAARGEEFTQKEKANPAPVLP